MTEATEPSDHEADWIGLALESTAHTLLVRRPGDPDAGIHAAIDQFASSLDVESVSLFRLNNGELSCLAAWSPGNQVLSGRRRAAIVDPLLESLRPVVVRTSPGAVPFADLDAASLATMGEWGHTSGSLAIVPTMADGTQVGGLTVVVRDDRSWLPEHFEALDKLALALHFFLERCEAETAMERQAGLDRLRALASAQFMEPVVEAGAADDATGVVLKAVAETFNADLVMWGNRIQPEQTIPGLMYHRETDVVTQMPEARLIPRARIGEESGVVRVHLDDDAHARLGFDRDVARDAITNVATTRLGNDDIGGLALLYLEDSPRYDRASTNALADVNRLIHQYQTGVRERQANLRHANFDAMRATLAQTFIESPPQTVVELMDTALPMVGAAFQAGFLRFRPTSDSALKESYTWASERAAAMMETVGDSDALFERLGESLDRYDQPHRVTEDEIDTRSRDELGSAGLPEVTIMRARVSDASRDATLAVAAPGHREWSTVEHAALVSAGTLLQQMADAIAARELVAVHDELDELASRCAQALILRSGDQAVNDVLTEIGTFFDARYVAWIQADGDRRVLRPTHAWPGRILDPSPIPLSETSWATVAHDLQSAKISTWGEAPHEAIGKLRVDARHLIVPVATGHEQFSVLNAEIGDYEHAELALRTLEAIAGMLWEVERRSQATQLFTTTFQSAPTGQALLDDEGVVTNVNDALQAMLGDLVGQSWEDLDAGWSTEQRNSAPREQPLANGTHAIWARLRSSAIPTALGGALTLVHVEDISAERANRAELEYQASHDKLTGLGNRRTLESRLAAALVGGEATVLMLDIDRFKVINDSLGHSAGDRVLTTIADRLRMAVRAQDIVCRFGGDEFTIIVPGTVDKFEIAGLASRVSELVRAPIELEQTTVVSTTSIGIAHGERGSDPSSVLRHADAALYTAKTNGRQRFEFFDAADSDAIRDRLNLETGLRQAVQNREFIAWYQPEYDLRTGEILGVEALVRWDRPGEGIVPAYHFIDAAEEMGLAPAFSTQVLDEACAAVRRWLDAGHDLHVRVNIAAMQLQGDQLAGDIDRALERNQLDPRHLCIEVTERSLLVDIEAATQSLTKIRDRGIEVAIDDFGTGFSSLAWLKRLPVDTLKIDRAFVTSLETDTVDREIVKTIIGLAQVLDLDVVAEGVEQEGQVELLRSLGCHRAQGWLWSPAVPAREIASLLDANRITY